MKTYKRKHYSTVFVVTAFTLFFSSFVFASEVGKVTYVEGRVDLLKPDSEMAKPIIEGEAISIGDSVRTKSNSKAEVTFNDRSVVRVAQNSRVDIKDYQFESDGKRKTATIALERGKIRTIISKTPTAAEFNINTPNAKGVVRGSDIFTFYQAGNSGMLVSEGKLSISNVAHPENEIIIPAGSSVLVPLEEAPSGPRTYIELEKKLHEQDTSVPAAISKKGKDAIIRGEVAKVTGDVMITKKGESTAHGARVNEILVEGDRINTGTNGMIEIKLDNGNAINLKPGTNLLIVKMTLDPKSGEYENLFESDMGKIRSRIEGLKGRSKFEVKTPTAVSGARGTIMYLEVVPNMTKSFFEGGRGYITSLMSGMTKVIEMGQNSYADSTGNVTDSTYTTDGERMDMSEGWDPGNGTEGYSSPGGGTGTYEFTANTGSSNDINTDLADNDYGRRGIFSDVPFTESNPTNNNNNTTNDSTVIENTSFNIDLDGSFGHAGYVDDNIVFITEENSILSALISANVDIAHEWSGSIPAVISGTTSHSDGVDLARGTVNGSSSEGGAILGWMGGGGFLDMWVGAFSALYIDPSGIAGTLFGLFSGMNSEDRNDGFSGNGVISILPMIKTDILPEDLAKEGSTVTSSGTGSFYASFFNEEGFISASFVRDAMALRGETWGIWQDVYKGDYYNYSEAENWSSAIGGTYNENGYFIKTFEGIDNLKGSFIVDMMSAYIDYTTFGIYTGTMLGKNIVDGEYSSYGSFEGIGLGTWIEGPLIWSGKVDAYYHYFDGEYSAIGYDDTDNNIGIIGSIESPFEMPGVPVDSFLMGEAYPDGHKTWWGYLHGLSYTGDGTILPDGAIGGVINSSNGDLKGIAACLYVDSFGNAGTLLGDFEGSYFSSLDMWMALGTLTATRRVTDHTGNDYDSNSITGYLNGSFDGGGTIYNESNIYDTSYGYLTSYTSNLLNLSTLWGVYNIELGGYYNDPSDSWTMALTGDSWAARGDNHDYWVASVSGNKWSDGELMGELNGIWLRPAGDGMVKAGTISGRVVGDYIDVPEVGKTWQAISVGEWVEVSDLLSEHTMFGAEGLSKLNDFVNVPVTEVYSSIMTGAGTGGITQAAMNINLYAAQDVLSHGIWTALINGNYIGSVSPNWTATVVNGSDTATLTGTHWENGQWVATVSGNVGGNAITNGQAGGTYGDGAFLGVGAGTWGETIP